MEKLVPPCAYQGGKSKVASQIVNYIINRNFITLLEKMVQKYTIIEKIQKMKNG